MRPRRRPRQRSRHAPDHPLARDASCIHGTHDTRKIGRRSSDGCIGLFSSAVADLFDITPIGTRVRLI
ncbi:MAG: L,D-transpeptidase [Proteobacteria bacterium]|nr:L,D-transpeptidase [Pseudomonadota bacterium]